ncbi:hypothetical protein EPD60_13485 [Flaviaesturariibacter flavus]|uniref:DUF1735 domain-containing protein n=1 Tax=Flaviaesturariibacter flavus TaxID=2502780 RepID=A0A4R1B8W9_9BACT|nr:hypothetical protein [Flaviaesturariibacter flavus]TCJ13395.1 hypothetical protein EPD60_13485 [Flaviaesturariibacter flavus]
MKILKYSVFALAALSLTSCLKSKTDFGGTLNDGGGIVSLIAEKGYQATTTGNLGLTYRIATNFNFSARPNEAVKFFTITVSQPREAKLSGPMTINVDMAPLPSNAIPAPGTTAFFPAGAVNVQPVTIQPSDAPEINVPVYFTVNKTLLDPTKRYGARFTISSPTQGVVSKNEGFADVYVNLSAAFNNSNYTGRYVGTNTIVDSAGIYGIVNNTRQMRLYEGDPFVGFIPNIISPISRYDLAFTGQALFSIQAPKLSEGGFSYQLVAAQYKLDATGKVIDVIDEATGLSLNPIFDNSVPNSFVYTANDQRVLWVKYKIRLDPDNNLRRSFTIEEKFVYDALQTY